MSGVEFASSEDEAIVWYDRAKTTSRAARRDAARIWLMKPWQLRVRAEHMRPHDCAVDHDGVEAAEWADGEDREHCFYAEEGWQYVCGADHPAAIAVWRVIPIAAPVWWWTMRRRLRQLHPAIRGAYGRPAVLWGGRVERKPNWLDRLLVGRSVITLPAGPWHRLGQGRIMWCDTCGRQTLHTHCPKRRAPFSCLADCHHVRRMAELQRPALRAVPSPTESRQEAP